MKPIIQHEQNLTEGWTLQRS